MVIRVANLEAGVFSGGILDPLNALLEVGRILISRQDGDGPFALHNFGQFIHDDDSFFRKGGQLGYNYTLGTRAVHDLHFGYMRESAYEDLNRASNGWGAISIPAGVGTAGTCPASACGTA